MSGVEVVAGAVCRNHPNVPAEARCTGCAEPLCANCLVNIRGQAFCGHCKVMALEGQPAIESLMIPCKEANEAFLYAIIACCCSIFCFGVIFGPIAIAKAVKARQLMAVNPYLLGSGKSLGAIIVGSLAFLFSLMVVIKGQAGR